jgi:membrane-bound lytic murein transglycosylase D
VKNIVLRPASFNLQTFPDLYNHPYFLSVPIEHDIDVALGDHARGAADRGVPVPQSRR